VGLPATHDTCALHLGEQAERDELHAGEHQQDAEQQERPVGDGLIPNSRW